MSHILGIDNDGADEEGPNDIEISRMNGEARNADYTIEAHQVYKKICMPLYKNMTIFLATPSRVDKIHGRPTNGIRCE